MSEHALEVISEYGEISVRLACHAAKGATCRMRPADLNLEEWTVDYEGEMIDAECWAVEWQSDAGFEEGVRSEFAGVYASVPVVISYDEGVMVHPEGEHVPLDGLEPGDTTTDRANS